MGMCKLLICDLLFNICKDGELSASGHDRLGRQDMRPFTESLLAVLDVVAQGDIFCPVLLFKT